MSVAERIDALAARHWLDETTARRLKLGAVLLPAETADRMIENVIGVFGLPLAVAPNFRVNGRDYVIPMVVEEPSIVAGVSGAARSALAEGGFRTHDDGSLAIGQILLTGMPDPASAGAHLLAEKEELLAKANASQPNLEARGGGAREVEVHATRLIARDGQDPDALVIHLLVDTCDAMGANLVNSMCEALAPHIERVTGSRALLKILSNLASRSLVTATATMRLSELDPDEERACEVRDAVVLANRFAQVDRHRAATHNKGIMNGIDAMAIATGNDWRAVEAAAHAFAARDGRYRALTDWSVDGEGNLSGRLVLPVKTGTVGGSLRANPAVDVSHALLGSPSARELSQLMAAVGLAQNFAALRALVTGGIQQGHMGLHARSVAASAGVPRQHFEKVVAGLIESGDVKIRKARELLGALVSAKDEIAVAQEEIHGSAAAKVILLGEHAAVYDRHVLALALPGAVTASVSEHTSETSISFSETGGDGRTVPDPMPSSLAPMVDLIVRQLGLQGRCFAIRLRSRVPRAAGLGSSAAVAVALIRALDRVCALGLPVDAVNRLAFECEKVAHGDPSGIDNTVATHAQAVLFRKNETPPARLLDLETYPPLVVAVSASRSSTREQVELVRGRYARMTPEYDAIFDAIGRLSIAGAAALEAGDYTRLGGLMNVCHGLLNAIGVSTVELEQMVDIARRHGAVGAKLTGAGGGGAIVALCPGCTRDVAGALQEAGFHTIQPFAGPAIDKQGD